MNNYLVSIIIPILNARKHIKKCLTSLINQTYKNIEIILVDNGSTDGTIRLIEEYESKDKRVKVFCEEKQGVFNARNTGIANSNGEFITFVDIDDYLEENAIEKEIKQIEEQNADILFFNYYKEDRDSIKKCDDNIEYGIYYENNKKIILERMCCEKYFASVWRGMYSAEIIKNKIFFRPTKYAEDLLFNIESIIKAKKIYVCNLLLYHYVDNELSSLKKLQYDLQNTIDFLNQLDCIVGENVNEDLQEIYIKSINICCLRILNTSIKYKEFKKWFSKIKLTNMMNNQDTMVKCINNNNFVRAYSILWKRKIINKIKRIA